ncbi:hypothetical protein AVEN_45906-1 [Araneus ventricosus]|uniref:Uncharacterized protein n=1 Tax=Araneus ventricosus TaxID=182803 RepID=A0A4Y2E8P2_ARAVE|nr:hypothetical protein AVEN_45906-1 [Araneus ventricosus]
MQISDEAKEKQFVGNLSVETFDTTANVQILTRTDKKYFTCDVCAKVFSQKRKYLFAYERGLLPEESIWQLGEWQEQKWLLRMTRYNEDTVFFRIMLSMKLIIYK